MNTTSRSRLRRLGVIVALSALALALLAPAALARVAYVANFDAGKVSVIDTATNEVIAPDIEVSDPPSSIAITPDGETAYVAIRSGEITVIDTRTDEPVGDSIPLDADAHTIAISPDGTTAYVSLKTSPGIKVLDLRTNQLAEAGIEVGDEIWGVAFAPDGRTAYVTDKDAGEVSVIDTGTRQVVGEPIPVGEAPVNVVFTPDGKTAFVSEEVDGNVYAIDTKTRQVTPIPVAPGEEVWGIAVTPDGTKAYAAAADANVLRVIDTRTLQVIGEPIPVGNEPYEVAFTPDGGTAYVANYGGDGVTVIDTATSKEVTTISTGNGAWQLAIVPDQSPVASFAAQSSAATTQVDFSGTASDADGTVTAFNWSFGDGTAAVNGGPTPSHTYPSGGSFAASLTVVDNEGCSTAQVFTGRTAYCSGSPLPTQTVTLAPNRFDFGKLTRSRGKGTAKLRVTVLTAGILELSGKRVKRVQRSVSQAGTVVLDIRPKPKLKKALRKKGRAKTRVRVSFYPTGGTAHSEEKPVRLVLR